MRRALAFVAAVLPASLVACGGAVDNGSPGPDAFVPGPGPTCLDGPHVDVQFVPLLLPHDPGESDALPPHVYASLTGCNLPPVDVAVDPHPHLVAALDGYHTVKTEAPGYLGTLGLEITPTLASTLTASVTIGGYVLSPKWIASFPDWSTSTTTILVFMSYRDADSPECRAMDGWTVRAPGVSGLHVVVLDDARPYLPTTSSVTTKSGLAVVSGVPAGSRVALVAERPGCTTKAFTTPVLENGLVTFSGAAGARDGPI